MARSIIRRRKAAFIGRLRRKEKGAVFYVATTVMAAAVAHVLAHAHVHARAVDGLVAHERIFTIRI